MCLQCFPEFDCLVNFCRCLSSREDLRVWQTIPPMGCTRPQQSLLHCHPLCVFPSFFRSCSPIYLIIYSYIFLRVVVNCFLQSCSTCLCCLFIFDCVLIFMPLGCCISQSAFTDSNLTIGRMLIQRLQQMCRFKKSYFVSFPCIFSPRMGLYYQIFKFSSVNHEAIFNIKLRTYTRKDCGVY